MNLTSHTTLGGVKHATHTAGYITSGTSSVGVDMVVKGERIDVDAMPSPVKVCI